MDFGKLNTKAAAERGAFIHWRHPSKGVTYWDKERGEERFIGDLLYGEDGLPLGAMLRGFESATVQMAVKNMSKAAVKGDAEKEADGYELVCSLLISFVGKIERDGRVLTSSVDDVRWFFGLSDAFVNQAVEFAKVRQSFFAETSPAASSPPNKSAS